MPKESLMGNRTSAPQPPTCETLVQLRGVSLTTRGVLFALAAWPDETTADLARRLDVDRKTIRRAMAEAERAGVIRLGPSTRAERGPITWAEHLTPPSPGGAPRPTPPAKEGRLAPPGGAPRPTSTPLPGMTSSCREVGQARTPPPRDPPIDTRSPATIATATALREAVSKVRHLRRSHGLTTGVVGDRKLGAILASVLAENDGIGLTLDEVAEAAGRALAVTGPSIGLELNKGKVARPPARRGVPRAAVMGTTADFAEAAAAFDQAAVLRSLGG
jgi:hypothetical protein